MKTATILLILGALFACLMFSSSEEVREKRFLGISSGEGGLGREKRSIVVGSGLENGKESVGSLKRMRRGPVIHG